MMGGGGAAMNPMMGPSVGAPMNPMMGSTPGAPMNPLMGMGMMAMGRGAPMGPAGVMGGVPGAPMQGQYPHGTLPPPAGAPGGVPLSQPPPKPTFQKMYVKTTAVEQLATTVSTTHITFLWTMLALVGGALLTASCMGARGKKSKKGEGSDSEGSEDEESSSSSDSE